MTFMRRVAIPAAIVILWLGAGCTEVSAAAGSNATAEAAVAGGGIDQCASTTQGQALIDCVGQVMGQFAAGVNRGEVPSKAPQILTMTREAATIRGKPKAQALSVLNRLVGVAKGLATKNAGDFGPAYNAVARVFTRAVGVIERKG